MVKMLIRGEQTDATAHDVLEVIDPATEEAYETVPAGGVDAVDLAVQAAHDAFEDWSRIDAEKRAEIMRKALDLIAADHEAIASTLTHEQGKPTLEAGGELQHFLHGMHYYADLATKVRGAYQDLPSTLGRSYGMVIKRPVGPVAAIEAFDDFGDALARANDSDFGLQAGVFTGDLAHAMQAWDALEVGGVVVGDIPSFRVDNMPYGGVKASGFGREGVRYAIADMTEPRLLVLRD